MELPAFVEDSSTRLSQVATQWTLLAQAQGDTRAAASEVWRALMHRYCGAAYRYLVGAVRNEELALELFQEFAVRFLRGDFRLADPHKGRFRDYVRTALMHLVTDHFRQIKAWPQALPEELIDPRDSAQDPDNANDQFVASWRDELIDRTWQTLAQSQPSYHALLMFHVGQPGILASELAARLAEELQRPISADNARVMLHRARRRFAELLVAEVEHSLERPTPAALEEELKTLRLWSMCEPAMASSNVATPGAEQPA
jgi:RNA polymerase sigma-70 factor (ECF subfamily)